MTGRKLEDVMVEIYDFGRSVVVFFNSWLTDFAIELRKCGQYFLALHNTNVNPRY